jgi:copper chaperone CopZ
MKKLLLVLSILFAAFIGNAQFHSANLTASGLTCAMCTKAIYNSLGKVPGIDKIDTDIQNSSFTIHFKDGSTVNPDAIKKAVQDAGFSVAKFQLTGNFSNVIVGKDAHVNIDHMVFHFLNGNNNSTLQGNRTITIVDKDFVSNKEFKKYEELTKYACVKSGKSEISCAKEGIAMNERIFHVTL